MSIMNEEREKDKVFDDRIEVFYKRFNIGRILRKINVVKLSGIKTCLIVLFVIKLVFSQKNLFRTLTSERKDVDFEKDVVYRLLGNSSARWEELVPLVSYEVIPVIADLTSEERRCALIYSRAVKIP